jgi:iron complex outermembrane receptor protein
MGASYTDAVFDEFLSPGSGVDLSGNEPPYTPEFKFDVIGRYSWPVGSSGGTIGIQADAVFTDDFFFTNENVSQLSQEGYWLVGANVGYTAAQDRWDARLWVKNLTDEEYLVGGFDFTFLGPYIMYPGDPRIYGASITVRF